MDLRDQLQATLGDAYALERELGGGGMSRVFIATETRLKRQVVVKVLTPELAAGVSAGRFEREIQLAASLQQANIVPILSAGEINGLPYYTMPFIDGQSLRARLIRDGLLPITEIVGIMRDVARALSYAHSHGVVHRDIKPDNVLLSHGTAVVTDFGIAKALLSARDLDDDTTTLTKTGTAIGTPAYMAPEQIAGDPTIDHRADVYAFGCLAYELVCGRPPFAQLQPQRVLAAHLADKPEPLRELRPDTPVSLAALVMRCLEKRPEDRPESANQIMHEIDAIAPPGARQSLSRSLRDGKGRRLWRNALVGVAALVIVAASAALWRRRATDAPQDRSLIVLPFRNLSGDTSNAYFGEGLAEEITNALTKAGLRVVARSSAGVLERNGVDPLTIARQLGVGSVLQGTVQRAGNQVRITVNLSASSDGTLLWSDKYVRQIRDIFAVQDSIARNVAAELRVALVAGTDQHLVRTETKDPEAHTLYLQGLYLWNRRTPSTVRSAISLFEQAVHRDSLYGRARAAMAMAYLVLPVYDDVPNDEMMARTREEAGRALAIDSTLVEAWAAVALTDAYQWRNAESERGFARAFQLDSTFATGYFWHALLLAHIGRFDEALRQARRAQELEPVSLVLNTAPGQVLYIARRFAEADTVYRHVLALEPDFQLALVGLARVQTERKAFAESIRLLEGIMARPGIRSCEKSGLLAYAYARAGRAADGRRVVARALKQSRLYWSCGALAGALDALGDHERALSVLSAAVDDHDQWMTIAGRGPAYDGLRGDPRGAALLRRIESASR